MAWASLSERERVPFEQDPEFAESFLGPLPSLDAFESGVFEFYWMARRSTSSEAPVDIERAIRLHRELFGPIDSIELIKYIQAMEEAYLEGFKRSLTKASSSN